jgi:predicted XRE-type DNA-binding protein
MSSSIYFVMAKKEKSSKPSLVKTQMFVKFVQDVTPEVLADVISQAEAAELRGISRASINELVVRGRLSVVPVGGRRFVLRSEVENFRDARTRSGGAGAAG